MCILISGCTYVDISHIPFCDDINVTGTDCHYIGDWFDKGEYNYSDGVCKWYDPYDPIGHPKMGICFSTFENDFNEIDEKFKKCWNCTESKTECAHAGDCSSNINLSGCSYDGCNYCCNNECTVMACEEESGNTSEYNFTFMPRWGPTSEPIPDDYKPIIIYETICDCSGVLYCEGWECNCDKYCYNKSKIIWIPNG